MIRMSTMRNTPVIIGQKTIGVLQSFDIDMAQKRVCALNVACGLRGRYMILPKDVVTISPEFILAENTVRSGQFDGKKNARFVRDSTGFLIGYVTDYAVSEENLQLAAIEMRIGFFPGEHKIRIWIMDFTCPSSEREIIVPSALGSELIEYAGRNW